MFVDLDVHIQGLLENALVNQYLLKDVHMTIDLCSCTLLQHITHILNGNCLYYSVLINLKNFLIFPVYLP